VTVSAHDLDELEVACDEVEQSAHQAYLDLQPLWGQQDIGFTQGALPIGRGLRPSNPLAGAPLWLLGPEVARFLDPLPGKAPYELATAFELAVAAGERVAGAEIGKTRDLTRPEDVIVENFPYLRGL